MGGNPEASRFAMLGAILIVMLRPAIRTPHLDQNYERIIIGAR